MFDLFVNGLRLVYYINSHTLCVSFCVCVCVPRYHEREGVALRCLYQRGELHLASYNDCFSSWHDVWFERKSLCNFFAANQWNHALPGPYTASRLGGGFLCPQSGTLHMHTYLITVIDINIISFNKMCILEQEKLKLSRRLITSAVERSFCFMFIIMFVVA